MWDVGVLDLELFKKAVLSHTFSNVICRWHNSAGAHLWGGEWVFLQGWSRATDSMVHRLPDQTNELTVDFRNMAEQAKKTQQRLYFLSVIRKNNISQKLWVSFYQYSIESILYYCFCVWFSAPQQHREKHSSESLRLPRKPSTVLYPLLKNCTGPTAVGKPRTLKNVLGWTGVITGALKQVAIRALDTTLHHV